MSTAPNMLRLPTVLNKTGLSRSSLYQLMKYRKFPTPVKIGVRSVAWVEDEVNAWLYEVVQSSRASD